MFAPPTRTLTVSLGADPDPAEVERAAARLRAEPGLGAVVLASAVVLHEHLLYLEPLPAGGPDAGWPERLCAALVRRGYLVEGSAGHVSPPDLTRRGRVAQVRRRWRRRRFIRALRREAWLVGAPLVLDIADDLDVQPGVRIEVRPQGGSLRIGPRCSIAAGVILRLGGDVELVRNVEVRYDVALNVKGRLVLHGRNVLGRGTMVHADGDMTFEWGACTSEYVSVLDSHHDYDGSLVHVHDQGNQVQDVTIGAATLLGARVMVMPGVRVGRACLVGSHSVVTKDVPDGWIAVGAPARHLRPVVEEQTKPRRSRK